MSEASDAADDMEPHIAAAGADADERSPGTDLTLPEPSDEHRNKIPATRARAFSGEADEAPPVRVTHSSPRDTRTHDERGGGGRTRFRHRDDHG
jgi:hypothetical protein